MPKKPRYPVEALEKMATSALAPNDNDAVDTDWELLSSDDDSSSKDDGDMASCAFLRASVVSLDSESMAPLSSSPSTLDGIDEVLTLSTQRSTISNSAGVFSDDECSRGGFEAKPQSVQRQTSIQSQSSMHLGDISDAVDAELDIKTRRALAFNNPNRCKGKTRRRKCPCSRCREKFRGMIVPHHPYLRGDNGIEPRRYPVTKFDLLGLPQTTKKSGNWQLLRDALEDVAASKQLPTRGSRAGYDVRKVELYDVELVGELITPQQVYKHEEFIASEKSKPEIRAWKAFKKHTYYVQKERLRPLTFRASDVAEFSSAVSALQTPVAVALNPDEEYTHGRASFYSRLTRQKPSTYLTSSTMVSSCLVEEELDLVARNRLGMWSGVFQSVLNHAKCWASQPVEDPDYDDWYLEYDLWCERHIRAVVIQGQAPVLRQFPEPVHFTSPTEAVKYKGPMWPVVYASDSNWVERVEISVRFAHQDWFVVGVFRANHDPYSEVRIDLHLARPIKGLRIKPLSRRKGGYHGDAPAMRCGLLAVRKTKEVVAEVADPNRVPEGFVRYELRIPDPSAEGVRESAKYVAGRAADLCGASSDYKYAWNNKVGGERFHKKKAFQMMMNDSDTYEE